MTRCTHALIPTDVALALTRLQREGRAAREVPDDSRLREIGREVMAAEARITSCEREAHPGDPNHRSGDTTWVDPEPDCDAEPYDPAPSFGFPIGPWHRWFAWRPTQTVDRGWRWLRPVWRRRFQTHDFLPTATHQWFLTSVEAPDGATP